MCVSGCKSIGLTTSPPEAVAPPSQSAAVGCEHDFTNEVWYCIVSIWGAMFTSVLPPLVVEFVRYKMDLARNESARGKRNRVDKRSLAEQGQGTVDENKPPAGADADRGTGQIEHPPVRESGDAEDDIDLVAHFLARRLVSRLQGKGSKCVLQQPGTLCEHVEPNSSGVAAFCADDSA